MSDEPYDDSPIQVRDVTGAADSTETDVKVSFGYEGGSFTFEVTGPMDQVHVFETLLSERGIQVVLGGIAQAAQKQQ